MPFAIKRTDTNEYLCRKGSWRARAWSANIADAAIWSTAGPGKNAANQSLPYRERQTAEKPWVAVPVTIQETTIVHP